MTIRMAMPMTVLDMSIRVVIVVATSSLAVMLVATSLRLWLRFTVHRDARHCG
jgi:hypothetical protein